MHKKFSSFEAIFGRKPNTPLSITSVKHKLCNLSYENIVNHYLDEDTVTPDNILPDDKWLNGYRSDLEVELGMTWAAREANERQQASTKRRITLYSFRRLPANSHYGENSETQIGPQNTRKT